MTSRTNSWIGVLIALLALGGSTWLLLPKRNVFGNPAYEERIDECVIPGTEDIVRLYHGAGRKTVKDWYSVTYRRSGLHAERQVAYTYDYPALQGIQCAANAVSIVGLDQEIDVQRIRNELRQTPLGWYQGEPRSTSALPARVLRVVLGLILLGAAAVLLRRIRQEPGLELE